MISANAQGPDHRNAGPQQALALHGSGQQQGSPDKDTSGCSLEALPGHSQPEVGTHPGATAQHSGHPVGQIEHSLLANQQPAQSEQPQTAAELKQNTGAGSSVTAAAAAVGVSGQMQVKSSIWSGLDPHIRSGLEHALSHSPHLRAHPQQASACLPGFGTPIAPPPAGPAEDFSDDQLATKAVQLPLRSGVARQGVEEGSLEGLERASRGAEQPVTRAQQVEGSQPSSSSLKRVPETPDSVENRSQPTQSPGESSHEAPVDCLLVP